MSFPQLAFANPELRRLARVHFSWRRVVLLTLLTLAGVIFFTLLAWGGAYNAKFDTVNISEFAKNANGFAQVGLFAALFVIAPAMTALSFVQEKLRGTAIFQQMSLIAPHKLLSGKFLGHGLISYLVAGLIFPMFLLTAPLDIPTNRRAPWILLSLIVGGLSWQAIALYGSAVAAGTNDKPMRGGLFLSPLIAGAGGISAIILVKTIDTAFYDWDYHRNTATFYGVTVPEFFIPLSALAFAGVWSYIGALRRVKDNQLIPLSPVTTWLFFVTGEVLLCGWLWGRASFDSLKRDSYYSGSSEDLTSKLVCFVAINLVVLVCLASSAALNRTQLREWQSVLRDPHYLFRRRELKNTALTLAFALISALIGYTALWFSYHAGLYDFPANLELATQLLPLLLAFTLTVIGAAALVQYTALGRFRWQGNTGVALVAGLFFLTLIGASMGGKKDSPFALANPALYVGAVTDHDRTLEMRAEIRSGAYLQRPACFENTGPYAREQLDNCLYKQQKSYYDEQATPLARSTMQMRAWGGVGLQTVWALLMLGLLFHKWRQLRVVE